MDRRNGRFNPNSPPPRWLHCPRKSGTLIAGKFLVFKTPLGPQYDDYVPEECRFYPSMLFASLTSYKVKMGLWIDLTNTSRFYNSKEIEEQGVKYCKLQCRGHGECPSEEQTNAFIKVCHKFISQNPLEIIGVHCTHGFNRSGFLIISYLVENLSWSVDAAVQSFSDSRPPGIYKQDYLTELFKRFADIADAPPAPTLPDWCDENDNVDDDGNLIEEGGGKGGRESNFRRRKEMVKKNPTFMDGVPGVHPVSQPTLGKVQRKCQDMCRWKGSGFPGSQPVSMDQKSIKLLAAKPYKVSWKADGTRYMMLIDGEDQVYFIDRDNCVFKVNNLRFPQRKSPMEHISDTLLDGEMVIDKVQDQPMPRYLVYDIIQYQGQDVGNADFDRRLLCINKEIIESRQKAMMDGLIDKNQEPFSVRNKQFFDLSLTKDLLGEKFQKKLSHEIDGLIFQPSREVYVSGRCVEVLKWKPPSLNSVDFRLAIHKEQRDGMLPENKGLLFVGGFDRPFSEIKVTKELRQYDKKIIECMFSNGQWKFMRERTDKSFPNAYETAMGVCESIRCPITNEMLIDFIDHHQWRPQPTYKRPAELPPPSHVPKRPRP